MKVGATPGKGSLHSHCSGKTWAMPSRTRFSSGQKSQPLQGGRVGVRGFDFWSQHCRRQGLERLKWLESACECV